MTLARPAAPSFLSLLVALALLSGGASRASGQCSNLWRPGHGIPGVNNHVYDTMTWDPDGAGPATPVVVLGGTFTVADTVAASGIATWDPLTGDWSALGAGLDLGSSGSVRVLGVLANGDLVAGGQFSVPGGYGIARWDGATWSPLGSGPGGIVLALTLLANGDLIAGGTFSSRGYVARWDGSTWSMLGSGVDGLVWAVTAMPNGDVVAGGEFTSAGGASANRIARWDGSTWSTLGSGTSGPVYALLPRPNGDLAVGGYFTAAGGAIANYVAHWNGAAWSTLGTGLSFSTLSFTALDNGDLLACGAFPSAGGQTAGGVARWNGTAWSVLNTGLGTPNVHSVSILPNGDLLAGGQFTVTGSPSSLPALRLARWNGSVWAAIGTGMERPVVAVAPLPDGHYVAAGSFTRAGSTAARHIARWDGADWLPLGSGPGFQSLAAVTTMGNGDIVAGGNNGLTFPNIARWNGATWTLLGSGVNGTAHCFLRLPNDDLIVGGRFNTAGGVPANFVARWDGAAWSPLGAGMNNGINAAIHALLRMPNGDIIAGGFFNTAGGVNASHIARWDGTTWSPLGSGMDLAVLALGLLPNGDLVAAGDFTTAGGVNANRVARWDGTSWWPLGSGANSRVNALLVLPAGDVLIGGRFTSAGGNSVVGLARWSGSAWSRIDPALATVGSVAALASLANGDVVVGGEFIAPGRSYVSQLSTTCPATATAHGAGCASSVGTMTLRADSLPWVGATFRSTCTAMAPGSLGVGLLGITAPGVPLSLLHPAAGPGCDLLCSLEVILLLPSSNGSVVTEFGVPVNPGLVGALLRHQMLQVELDQMFNITLLSGSNGLTLTVGAF